MSNSRTKNAILNIVVGFVSQMGILLLSFVGRAVFVQFLDISYLGINGLYSNILSVLALAELGLGNVIQFFLYKPVAENNKPLINSLVKYFQKLYFIIAIVVFILGVAFIPFLKYIVNSDLSQKELIIYYVLFLLNSVISYFAAHKIALFAAYQDIRLQKYTMLITNFLAQILHIVVLYICHSYVLYVVVTVLATIINAVLINVISNKRYSFLRLQKVENIPKVYRKHIVENIKSTFVYKIGATIVNNTDNILISIIISTAAVGLYSNYFMVVAAIQGFISIITTSLISGIGNLSAIGNVKRMKSVFNTLLLAYHVIAIFGAVSLYFLFDDLISIWLGNQFLLDKFTVFAISFSFYLTNAISPIWMFREANGLFKKVKYLLIATSVANIVLSILLGRIWGMAGILLATSVARIVTQVWYEPKILYSIVFKVSQKSYWLRETWYSILSIIAVFFCWQVTLCLPHSFLWMLLKGILFLVICILTYGIGNAKTAEIQEVLGFAKKLRFSDIKNKNTRNGE